MYWRHLTLRAWIGWVFVTATGCYAAREPVPPEDAFHAPDGGTDAFRLDTTQTPDAVLPDAVLPDAFPLPDAWFPELGPDCSLGGSEDAYEFSGSDSISRGRVWRALAPEWVSVEVHEVEDFRAGITRQTLFFVGPSPTWYFTFQSPDGSSLRPGEFLNAQRAPFAEVGHVGVDVSGYGNGCDGTDDGSLTIHEISVVDGQLRRLRASFTQTCFPADGTLTGCIRYTSP